MTIPSHALPHVVTVGWGVVVGLLVGGGPHVSGEGRGWARAVLHMCWEWGVCGEGAIVAYPWEMHRVARREPEG